MQLQNFVFTCGVFFCSTMVYGLEWIKERQPTFIASGANDAKIQFSLQQELVERSSLFFAYTMQGFWLRDVPSAPFKELTHHPEIFWKSEFGDLGYEHESNGLDNRSTDYQGQSHRSRSLQRLYWQDFQLLRRGYWSAGMKAMVPVYLKKTSPYHNYMGYGDLGINYESPQATFELRARSGTKGGRVIGNVSFNPLSFFDPGWSRRNRTWLFAEYFQGYGESLIDYDRFSSSLRLGLRLLI